MENSATRGPAAEHSATEDSAAGDSVAGDSAAGDSAARESAAGDSAPGEFAAMGKGSELSIDDEVIFQGDDVTAVTTSAMPGSATDSDKVMPLGSNGPEQVLPERRVVHENNGSVTANAIHAESHSPTFADEVADGVDTQHTQNSVTPSNSLAAKKLEALEEARRVERAEKHRKAAKAALKAKEQLELERRLTRRAERAILKRKQEEEIQRRRTQQAAKLKERSKAKKKGGFFSSWSCCHRKGDESAVLSRASSRRPSDASVGGLSRGYSANGPRMKQQSIASGAVEIDQTARSSKNTSDATSNSSHTGKCKNWECTCHAFKSDRDDDAAGISDDKEGQESICATCGHPNRDHEVSDSDEGGQGRSPRNKAVDLETVELDLPAEVDQWETIEISKDKPISMEQSLEPQALESQAMEKRGGEPAHDDLDGIGVAELADLSADDNAGDSNSNSSPQSAETSTALVNSVPATLAAAASMANALSDADVVAVVAASHDAAARQAEQEREEMARLAIASRVSAESGATKSEGGSECIESGVEQNEPATAVALPPMLDASGDSLQVPDSKSEKPDGLAGAKIMRDSDGANADIGPFDGHAEPSDGQAEPSDVQGEPSDVQGEPSDNQADPANDQDQLSHEQQAAKPSSSGRTQSAEQELLDAQADAARIVRAAEVEAVQITSRAEAEAIRQAALLEASRIREAALAEAQRAREELEVATAVERACMCSMSLFETRMSLFTLSHCAYLSTAHCGCCSNK